MPSQINHSTENRAEMLSLTSIITGPTQIAFGCCPTLRATPLNFSVKQKILIFESAVYILFYSLSRISLPSVHKLRIGCWPIQYKPRQTNQEELSLEYIRFTEVLDSSLTDWDSTDTGAFTLPSNQLHCYQATNRQPTTWTHSSLVSILHII